MARPDSAQKRLHDWDPAWAEAYADVRSDPWTNGILPEKTVELLCVAVNVACTQLQPEGTRRHLRAALDAGATRDELLAVMEMGAMLAIHACSVGAPILVEEAHAVSAALPERGGPTPAADRMRAMGRWNAAWDPFFDLDPRWTDLFMDASVCLYTSGVLSPTLIELVNIALNAGITHLYAPGARRHIRAALALGVTPEQIMEVLKVCVACGAESIHLGVPLLAEELEAFERRTKKRQLTPA